MPLLASLMRRFAGQRPFAGLSIAACLHVTAETAMMVRLLQAGGASVSLAASNPLSTQDDIAAALAARYGTAVFARAGVDRRGYYRHIELALAHPPAAPTWSLTTAGTWSTRCTPGRRTWSPRSGAGASRPPPA